MMSMYFAKSCLSKHLYIGPNTLWYILQALQLSIWIMQIFHISIFCRSCGCLYGAWLGLINIFSVLDKFVHNSVNYKIPTILKCSTSPLLLFFAFSFFFTCRATNRQPFSENVNLLQFDEHRYMESAILHVQAVYCSQCTNIYGSYCKECYNKTVT